MEQNKGRGSRFVVGERVVPQIAYLGSATSHDEIYFNLNLSAFFDHTISKEP
jgi:hypothetical protein